MTSSQTEGESQISILRGANKVLSFVSLATGFAASFLLEPFGALAYTTLATYCLTEDISLKNMFKKAFNPVIVAISNSKVTDYVRNNKKQVLLALGIGVTSLGWMVLQTLLPALSGLTSFGSLGLGFGGIAIGMVNTNPNLNKDENDYDFDIDFEVKELIKNLAGVEASTLSITDKEAIKRYYIDESVDSINTFSTEKISRNDLKSRAETLIKEATSIEKMSYFEFHEFYGSYFDNQYSEQFKTLDFSNSLGVKSSGVDVSKRYPNSQDKLLQKYHELSRKATKPEELPFIIYALVNTERPQDSVRTGYTVRLPSVRKSDYGAESKNPDLQYNPLYREIQSQGIDTFKMIILDVQIGKENAKASENFFTFYFNRDMKAKDGFDLSKNRRYNRIVGDIGDSTGEDNHRYIQGIYSDDLSSKIEYGYELKDLAVIYGVSQTTLVSRIKMFYADKFGSDVGYIEIASYLRSKKLIDLYSQGLNVKDIALQFKKFDIKGKKELWKHSEDIKEAHEQYIKGNIPETSYTSASINRWTREYLGMDSVAAYEKYFVKPIVISLLQCGFQTSQALELLEAMGITNPNNKGVPYDKQTLNKMLKNRLWGEKGESWMKMRNIFLEPIIENLVRNGKKAAEIDRLLDLPSKFTSRYVKRVWRFASYQDALKFFRLNFLGKHRVDNFLFL